LSLFEKLRGMEKDRKHSKAMSNDENFKQLQMEGKVLL
jgi:hypothetical protein